MLYRAWIAGSWKVTADLSEIEHCESIDIFIRGIWQVFK